MSSYKNIQAGRQKKDSHFTYSTARMTRLTSSEAAPLKQKHGAVLSVKPNQDPVQRTAEAAGEAEEAAQSTQSSLSSDLEINTEALSKLQVTNQIQSSLKPASLASFTGNNRSSKEFPEVSRDDQHLEVEAE